MTGTRNPFRRLSYGLAVLSVAVMPGLAFAQDQDKPNILVIWGDDIGQSNISAYTMDGIPDAKHRQSGQRGDDLY